MTTTPRYDRISIALHWIIAVGIIALACGEMLREELPRGTVLRDSLKILHNPAGTIVFALIIVRIAWRLMTPGLASPPGSPGWEKVAAKLTHLALYAMMLAIPLLGIVYTLARGRPIDFGLFQIVYPLDHLISRGSARTLKELHGWLGQGILGLAFLHAAAALWHHYVRKDDVLSRMLPVRRRPEIEIGRGEIRATPPPRR